VAWFCILNTQTDEANTSNQSHIRYPRSAFNQLLMPYCYLKSYSQTRIHPFFIQMSIHRSRDHPTAVDRSGDKPMRLMNFMLPRAVFFCCLIALVFNTLCPKRLSSNFTKYLLTTGYACKNLGLLRENPQRCNISRMSDIHKAKI
jgi:hypothetical protein